jgi:hypothetical protein
MTQDTNASIVEDYLRYLEHIRLPANLPETREDFAALLAEHDRQRESNPYRDAWEPVDDLIRSDPESAWRVLLESLSRCHESDLSMIGTGSLESFMWRRGVTFLDRVLEGIRTNSRLRDAFASVYLGSDFPEAAGRSINSVLIDSGLPEESTIDWWTAKDG